jgi:hypothetical protein
MLKTKGSAAEVAIWTRIIEPEKNRLSRQAARSLLEFTFSERDKARMNELAQRNREGLLTADERQELEGYVKVGDVLSLIHLKARKSLKDKSRGPSRQQEASPRRLDVPAPRARLEAEGCVEGQYL